MTQQHIYFGHPTPFWKDRKRIGKKSLLKMDDASKLSDIVNYDALHLQHAIINRTSEKVQKLLKQQEISLNIRRERLKNLLDSEEIQYLQELDSLRRTEKFLEEQRKLEKKKEKEDELEREKARACQKALEREKIARGMQSSKEDELQLRLMQKMQIEERKLIEQERRYTENMWHQVLIDDVRRKDMAEQMAETKRQQDMVERRRRYDEQIANAQQLRSKMIQDEREKEMRRLARVHEGLEREKIEEQQRKKHQQYLNKVNYIEGHKEKLARLHENMCEECRIDSDTIQRALEEMQQERRRKYLEMNNLQKTENIFTEISQKEKEDAAKADELADKFIEDWQHTARSKADQCKKEEKRKREQEKEKLSADYKRHIEKVNQIKAKEKEGRSSKMERIRRMARGELAKKAESAQNEFLNQIEYRRGLNEQIALNQQVLISEIQAQEEKQLPFTRKPENFRDKMKLFIDQSPGRNSTNPVHPFRRIMESKEGNSLHCLLPPISRCF